MLLFQFRFFSFFGAFLRIFLDFLYFLLFLLNRRLRNRRNFEIRIARKCVLASLNYLSPFGKT